MSNRTWLKLIALSILLVAAACAEMEQEAAAREKVYKAEGVVYAVEPEDGTIVISHGEIPGLMGAMTMRFAVKDTAVLKRFAAQDEVKFDVSIGEGEYIANNIEKQAL